MPKMAGYDIRDKTALVTGGNRGIGRAIVEVAGLTAAAVSPALVGEGVDAALREGRFYVFPDPMAQGVWAAYRGFAEQMIESRFGES